METTTLFSLTQTDPKILVNHQKFIIEHLTIAASRYGDKRAALEFRKFTPYYFKGMVGVKELKNSINQSDSTVEIIDLINTSL